MTGEEMFWKLENFLLSLFRKKEKKIFKINFYLNLFNKDQKFHFVQYFTTK